MPWRGVAVVPVLVRVPLLLLLLLTSYLGSSNSSDGNSLHGGNSNNTFYVNNHTFVFGSGWPQSGTSLMNHMLVHSRHISNMINGCEALLGTKRCTAWNHEGQWLLDGHTRLKISSGSTCPVDSVPEDVRSSILRQWKGLWDLDKQVLLEKSPQ